MTNPPEAYLPHDTSRWTWTSGRHDTPSFLRTEMLRMFRELYGDEAADAMEASIPPPWGTWGT